MTETMRNGFEQKKRVYLTAEAILRYLITDDDILGTLIMCKAGEFELHTTDKDVYEALGSVRPNDAFKLNKLTKFFEGVTIQKAAKTILTEARVDTLRKIALAQQKNI